MPRSVNLLPRALVAQLLLSIIGLAQTGPSPVVLPPKFAIPDSPIQLERRARSDHFDAVGRRSGVFGTERGRFESWIFPLKLFHGASISIAVQGVDRIVEFGERIDRISVRPESTTLHASDQFFTIRATFFSPIDEPASIILLDIDADRPLTLTISFTPDLKPMWPGGLGGQSAIWRDDLKAFQLSESRRRYNGFFGSPLAVRGISTPAHQLGEGGLRFDIRVTPQDCRRGYIPLLISGGIDGRPSAIERYQRLPSQIEESYRRTRAHYDRLRREFLSVRSTDSRFDLAFEWAKVALDKGMIDNPELGLGLVAGLGPSGSGARPGFAWYFGGDMAINSLAMTGYGDFDSVRAALAFAARHQRADGKIPHEVSQSAAQLRWFDEYPYAYYHADTTPLFIIAAHQLYLQSGDIEDLRRISPVLRKAWQFCLDNDSDKDGILENSRAGLGASELGTLLSELHQDIYLAATNVEAARAISEMSRALADIALSESAAAQFELGLRSLGERYFDAASGRYSYAITKDGRQNPEVTAWSALPFVFGLIESGRADSTLDTLASSRLSTDWGVRMLDRRSRNYDPVAYNNGGVWPFLTGFASLAEYRYGRPHSAFEHLRQTAQMTFDFALGYHPEILSGEFYRPLDESVPHQLFSSGMVITPFVRGLMGIEVNAVERRVKIAPQLPAAWNDLRVDNLRVGRARLRLDISRPAVARFRYEFQLDAPEAISIDLFPFLPPGARIASASIDGATAPCLPGATPGACRLEVLLRRSSTVIINLSGGIEFDLQTARPEVGDRSANPKLISMRNLDAGNLEVRLEMLPGRRYQIRCRTSLGVEVVSGGKAVVGKSGENGWIWVEVQAPATDDTASYVEHRLIVRLTTR